MTHALIAVCVVIALLTFLHNLGDQGRKDLLWTIAAVLMIVIPLLMRH